MCRCGCSALCRLLCPSRLRRRAGGTCRWRRRVILACQNDQAVRVYGLWFRTLGFSRLSIEHSALAERTRIYSPPVACASSRSFCFFIMWCTSNLKTAIYEVVRIAEGCGGHSKECMGAYFLAALVKYSGFPSPCLLVCELLRCSVKYLRRISGIGSWLAKPRCNLGRASSPPTRFLRLRCRRLKATSLGCFKTIC